MGRPDKIQIIQSYRNGLSPRGRPYEATEAEIKARPAAVRKPTAGLTTEPGKASSLG
jgi:hypothetical protein